MGPEQGVDMRCLGHVPRAEKGALPRALAVQGSSEGEQVTLLKRILPPWLGSPAPVVGCHVLQLQGSPGPFGSMALRKMLLRGKQIDLSVYFCGSCFHVTLGRLILPM